MGMGLEGGIEGYIDSRSEIIYYIAISRGSRLDGPHFLQHVTVCGVFFLGVHEEGENRYLLWAVFAFFAQTSGREGIERAHEKRDDNHDPSKPTNLPQSYKNSCIWGF